MVELKEFSIVYKSDYYKGFVLHYQALKTPS